MCALFVAYVVMEIRLHTCPPGGGGEGKSNLMEMSDKGRTGVV